MAETGRDGPSSSRENVNTHPRLQPLQLQLIPCPPLKLFWSPSMSEKSPCALKEQIGQTVKGQLSLLEQKEVGKGGRYEEAWGQCLLFSPRPALQVQGS